MGDDYNVVVVVDNNNNDDDDDGSNCMGNMSEKVEPSQKEACLLLLVVIGLIVFISCMVESVIYINYNEQALLQNTYTGVRLGRVYETGRYIFPLTYSMVIFPATFKQVKFVAVAFTDTGLELDVDIEFYYRLPKSTLGDVYDSFSLNYNDRVESNAKSTIKNLAADLTVDVYLTNRTDVQSLFAEAVKEVLWTNVKVEAPTELFRVGNVNLPSAVITRSLESVLAQQQNDILENQQQVVQIEAETSVQVSRIDAQAEQMTAFATNQALLETTEADSYVNQVVIRGRGEGIADLLTALDFDTSNYTTEIIRRLAQIDNALKTTMLSVANDGTNLQVVV